MADLSTSMLGQSGHFPEMIDFLQRETEGNVFFAVEIVRALAEEAGEIEKIGTTVRPTQITARGIQQIIRRRLARVPTEAYGLLQMAAVFGRRIDGSLLTAAEPSLDFMAGLVGWCY